MLSAAAGLVLPPTARGRSSLPVRSSPRVRSSPLVLTAVPMAPLVVALDVDGVLIDSEPELSHVAWRTSCQLWPEMTEACEVTDHLMDDAAYVDRRRLEGRPLCVEM